MREPVLLPPGEGAPRPLPRWVVGVALVGLFVLGVSTVPAVMRRARLARDHAQLRCETVAQERELRRLERELRAALRDSYARERALRALLHPPLPLAGPAAR